MSLDEYVGDTSLPSIQNLDLNSPPNFCTPASHGPAFTSTGLAVAHSEMTPLFQLLRVALQFPVQITHLRIASNLLLMALAGGNKLLRIDLGNPERVDDIEIVQGAKDKGRGVGEVRDMWVDPSGTHLLVATMNGEIYYLPARSPTPVRPRHLPKLKGLTITSVAWPLSTTPTSSTTGPLLVGTSTGTIYELSVQPEKKDGGGYVKQVWRTPNDESSITGIFYTNTNASLATTRGRTPAQKDEERVVTLTTASGKMFYFAGKITRTSDGGIPSFGTEFFDAKAPSYQEFPPSPTGLQISPSAYTTPKPSEDGEGYDATLETPHITWLTASGLFHGPLTLGAAEPFAEHALIPPSAWHAPEGQKNAHILVSRFHFIILSDMTVKAISRLDGRLVWTTTVPISSVKESILGVVADPVAQTLWLYTTTSIYEIVITDETRDVSATLLTQKRFEPAKIYASTPAQRDVVNIALADDLLTQGEYNAAAEVYAATSKDFDEVCLALIDAGEQLDALRLYLRAKMDTFGVVKKRSGPEMMGRCMVGTWLVEVYMAKLNALEDTSSSSAEEVESIKNEWKDFINRYKGDLDRKTVYDLTTSHGRNEELLSFATAVEDWSFILKYWVERSEWSKALQMLSKQTEPEVFYKYATVLMTHVPSETVDIWMRNANLNPRGLVPGLLAYNAKIGGRSTRNEAVRYLTYVTTTLGNTDAAVHNTLLGILVAASADETALSHYLRRQDGDKTMANGPYYDLDLGLRLCLQYGRVASCVHIYSSLGRYVQAVELALKHNDVELAISIADGPTDDDTLRKNLWLTVAKHVVKRDGGIKTAMGILKKCDLLKVEELMPYLPDFVLIDDFKEEICNALEDYSRQIDRLSKDMDTSTRSAETIRQDIASLQKRYAVIQPGERCYICQYPLLTRQFYIFPCSHCFHGDCLTTRVVQSSGLRRWQQRRITELQAEIQNAASTGGDVRKAKDELDEIVAGECVLCGDAVVRKIDEGFGGDAEEVASWAI
ncbi:hypothetical protein G7K_4608-t1 [Saitoella complicata NRRL Y-17804]|uniref:Uncharacterized protein n=2 Tax=Saitoella complicata (strain BCRC 22490 / CBS 7301 / JCM 7358 / NBRC 10748 / NRRL Y-17804) TaxID=698492 RepID=A0A0E9NKX1_SAICN|nr:hypothetical protein G7K_4608-t1 [Saitoella complicata NRRL Y-17804]